MTDQIRWTADGTLTRGWLSAGAQPAAGYSIQLEPLCTRDTTLGNIRALELDAFTRRTTSGIVDVIIGTGITALNGASTLTCGTTIGIRDENVVRTRIEADWTAANLTCGFAVASGAPLRIQGISSGTHWIAGTRKLGTRCGPTFTPGTTLGVHHVSISTRCALENWTYGASASADFAIVLVSLIPCRALEPAFRDPVLTAFCPAFGEARTLDAFLLVFIAVFASCAVEHLGTLPAGHHGEIHCGIRRFPTHALRTALAVDLQTQGTLQRTMGQLTDTGTRGAAGGVQLPSQSAGLPALQRWTRHRITSADLATVDVAFTPVGTRFNAVFHLRADNVAGQASAFAGFATRLIPNIPRDTEGVARRLTAHCIGLGIETVAGPTAVLILVAGLGAAVEQDGDALAGEDCAVTGSATLGVHQGAGLGWTRAPWGNNQAIQGLAGLVTNTHQATSGILLISKRTSAWTCDGRTGLRLAWRRGTLALGTTLVVRHKTSWTVKYGAAGGQLWTSR